LTELTGARNFPASRVPLGMAIKNAGDAHEDRELEDELRL
jgi:hypothetical protein